ncbi:GDSL-type esterase/lipase family protein [Paenibacillus sp. URB8-2]|uniref:GDSL-type esterase/lipase family protein n=1 Tax=Paenibacillus sp. URB8-2 TaxID=2741301 RepID=UPI0015BDB90C|nr:GDSL-type esterase/lipase family protein [Paenibacillus sp. URB8-2]BCG56732.1 spore germination lipase LipC [Paenibacillus sp. URB8-2]
MVYNYTAIGDSLTTGFGAMPGNGFVPVYRRMSEISLRTFVAYTNLGINGLTTAELEKLVSYNPQFRQSLREADLITISIGGNDLIHAAKAGGQSNSPSSVYQNALKESRRHFAGIMGQIHHAKAGAGKPYIIRIVGLYNPYPRVAEASGWVRQFNRLMAQYNSKVCGFADIYGAFAGYERELLSIDHLHPNGKGYRVIADRLQSIGYGSLSPN